MRRVYGLIGRKLGHSYSPDIHTAFGCRGYKLYELEPQEVEGFMKRPDLGAVNVTIPYKRDVFKYVDEVDPSAAAIGAINTVVNRNGRLCGYNTDIYGLEYAVKRAGLDFAGKKVVILGSGGTSLTARAAAKELGAAEIVVVSRTGENNYGNLSRHADAGILVNTTPVGMFPDCPASPVSLDAFPNLTGVMDVIFNPLRTALITEAERRGIPCSGGLRMLVAQAKAAEELFFGKELDTALIDGITDSLCRDASNIVLIGMPGVGKTTVGKLIARKSHRTFVDMDRVITASTGMSPADIIVNRGEEEFRRVETELLAQEAKKGGRVITTGGGVVTREENYTVLHQQGRIYRIDRPLDKLATKGRPLSAGGMDGLRALYEKRDPLYRRFADVTIQNTGTLEDAANAVWGDFIENTRY